MSMKRTLSLLAALLLLASLCACGEQGPTEYTTIPDGPTKNIPTTTQPPPTTTVKYPNAILAEGDSDSEEWAENFPFLMEPAEDYFAVVMRYSEMCDRGVQWGESLLKPRVHVMLYDLDGDFTPELLVCLEIGKYGQWQVYTMYKGETRWLGSFWEGALYSHSEGGIYINRQAHDIERWSRLTKKGNQLMEKELFNRYFLDEQEPFVPSDGVLLQYWLFGELAR